MQFSDSQDSVVAYNLIAFARLIVSTICLSLPGIHTDVFCRVTDNRILVVGKRGMHGQHSINLRMYRIHGEAGGPSRYTDRRD
ncbi:hypothetical protein BJX64DRAFT_265170 [Aspergillus heterothallicus]